MEGHACAASHSFIVATKMYKLTLYKCHANQQNDGAILNTLNNHVYAAIFSNLAHVHAMLGEISQSKANNF
jgi:hypothetical protein